MKTVEKLGGSYTQEESLEIEKNKLGNLKWDLEKKDRFYINREGMKQEVLELEEQVKNRTQFILDLKQ